MTEGSYDTQPSGYLVLALLHVSFLTVALEQDIVVREVM
jgi:hypothetical protein